MQRAKQCLDFTCTLFLFHLFFMSIYSKQVPSTFLWWLLTAASIGIMAVGGEYLCMRRELEPIDVGRNMTAARKRLASVAANNGNADVELSLLEQGERANV